MSLNFRFEGKVPECARDESGAWSGATECVAFLSMFTSQPDCGAPDFAARVAVYESLFGPVSTAGPMPVDVLAEFSGMRTNSSAKTWTGFWREMQRIYTARHNVKEGK